MKAIFIALVVSIALFLKIAKAQIKSKLWANTNDGVVPDLFVTSNGDVYFSFHSHYMHYTSKINKLSVASSYDSSLVAGGGPIAIPNNVSALSANLGIISSLTGTASGDVLYAAAPASFRIYKIDTVNQIVTVFMGTGSCGTAVPDGIVLQTQNVPLCGPTIFVEYDMTNNVLYYFDENRRHIRRYNPADSSLTTIVGFFDGVGFFGSGDYLATTTSTALSNFFVSSTGILYGTSYFSGTIRKIVPGGMITTVPWGKGPYPRGIAGDRWGNFYITYNVETAMKRVNASGVTSNYNFASTERGMSAIFSDNYGNLFFGGYQAVYAVFNSSIAPSRSPSRTPTWAPSREPSSPPTRLLTAPTAEPTVIPTQVPSTLPTALPTVYPSAIPATEPEVPSAEPTIHPSVIPTSLPTFSPSASPTFVPSEFPSSTPSAAPSNFCEASCNTLSKASVDAALVAAAARTIAEAMEASLAVLTAAANDLAAKVLSQTAAVQAAAANAATAEAHANALAAVVERCGDYIDYLPVTPHP